MLEKGTSGLMSGEGKRAAASRPRTALFLDSTRRCTLQRRRRSLQASLQSSLPRTGRRRWHPKARKTDSTGRCARLEKGGSDRRPCRISQSDLHGYAGGRCLITVCSAPQLLIMKMANKRSRDPEAATRRARHNIRAAFPQIRWIDEHRRGLRPFTNSQPRVTARPRTGARETVIALYPWRRPLRGQSWWSQHGVVFLAASAATASKTIRTQRRDVH